MVILLAIVSFVISFNLLLMNNYMKNNLILGGSDYIYGIIAIIIQKT
jgi:hypothetical protein